MTEGRGVALAILGIVALMAVVGLILLFTGRLTGQVVTNDIYGGYGSPKVYGGWNRAQENSPRSIDNPYAGSWVKGVPYTWEGQEVAVIGGEQATYRVPTAQTACPKGFIRAGTRRLGGMTEEQVDGCYDYGFGDGSLCCPPTGFDPFA